MAEKMEETTAEGVASYNEKIEHIRKEFETASKRRDQDQAKENELATGKDMEEYEMISDANIEINEKDDTDTRPVRVDSDVEVPFTPISTASTAFNEKQSAKEVTAADDDKYPLSDEECQAAEKRINDSIKDLKKEYSRQMDEHHREYIDLMRKRYQRAKEQSIEEAQRVAEEDVSIFEKFADWMREMWNRVFEALRAIKEALMNSVRRFGEYAKDVWDDVTSAMVWMKEKLYEILVAQNKVGPVGWEGVY
ncbi:hypothetical protein ABW19_dt0206966 [Dactylella cylindrospora]|nr:hypothetical protein ABW19_dt0206966 [Dactylella cylindrospora]